MLTEKDKKHPRFKILITCAKEAESYFEGLKEKVPGDFIVWQGNEQSASNHVCVTYTRERYNADNARSDEEASFIVHLRVDLADVEKLKAEQSVLEALTSFVGPRLVRYVIVDLDASYNTHSFAPTIPTPGLSLGMHPILQALVAKPGVRVCCVTKQDVDQPQAIQGLQVTYKKNIQNISSYVRALYGNLTATRAAGKGKIKVGIESQGEIDIVEFVLVGEKQGLEIKHLKTFNAQTPHFLVLYFQLNVLIVIKEGEDSTAAILSALGKTPGGATITSRPLPSNTMEAPPPPLANASPQQKLLGALVIGDYCSDNSQPGTSVASKFC